jgi:hypothetical protein
VNEKTTKSNNIPIKRDESLFELVQLSHKIQEILIENAGEITLDIEKSLSKLHEKIPEKCDAYKHVIDDLKSQADLWNERAANFSRVAKAFLSYTDSMKYSLKMACIELGVDEIVGRDYKWKLVNNAPSLVVDDEAQVPSKFKEVVQKTIIRSDLLKEALKSGETIAGAHIESGSHVRSFLNKGSK